MRNPCGMIVCQLEWQGLRRNPYSSFSSLLDHQQLDLFLAQAMNCSAHVFRGPDSSSLFGTELVAESHAQDWLPWLKTAEWTKVLSAFQRHEIQALLPQGVTTSRIIQLQFPVGLTKVLLWPHHSSISPSVQSYLLPCPQVLIPKAPITKFSIWKSASQGTWPKTIMDE